MLLELSIVRAVSEYVLLANDARNTALILFVHARFVYWILRWYGLLHSGVFICSILEDLSLGELEVAVWSRILCVETLTFISKSERCWGSSFHNSRFIWLSWQISSYTTELLVTLVAIELSILVPWLGAIECSVALAVDSKGTMSVEFCVVSRFLQIFIDRNFLKRDLLSWYATHEMIWPVPGTHLRITLPLMTVVRVSIWIFSLETTNPYWFPNGWAWVFVGTSMLWKTFQISLRLLMKMNWLGNSLIS